MKTVEIYTDGACKGNPGPGGWGALLVSGVHRKEIYGGEKETTNNRMEILAVIKALSTLKQGCHVILYTDSQYVLNGVTQWLAGWKEKGWKTAKKTPVKNVDLWQMLEQELHRHQIKWQWVRGHTGHDGNEQADALANKGVDLILNEEIKDTK